MKPLRFTLVWLCGLVAACTAAGAAVPGGAAQKGAPQAYVRRATWHETMIASREALSRMPRPAKTGVPLPNFGESDFTILAWVRTTRGGTILAKAPPKGQWVAQGKSLFVRGGKVCFDIGWVGAVSGNRPVADGQWHHVALTGGKDLRIYVDGRLDASGSLDAQGDVQGSVVKIGNTSDNFPSPSGFSGELDEVRVYSRALWDKEIQAHFEKPAPRTEPGLTAYWPFDGDAQDASGCLNHATRVAGGEFVAGKIGKALRLGGNGELIVPSGDVRSPYEGLWAALQRDFTDAASRQEMAWEREDRIWEFPWQAGDWAALARRYALLEKASGRAGTTAEQAARLAAAVKDRAGLAEVRDLYLRSRRYAVVLARLGEYNFPGLRKAIVALCRIDQGAEKYLARLDALEGCVARWQDGRIDPEELAKWRRDVEQLKRDALIAGNPLIDFDKLLFVKRYTYQSNHYYTDYINGCRHYGGNLCVLSLKDGTVAQLVPSMKEGIFGRFDLSFDGKRVLFDWKASAVVGFRLYEVGVDGRGLRQVTFDPPDEQERIRKYRNDITTWQGYPLEYFHYTDDMQPCYLPDGGICFISTRCEFGTLCDGPDVFTTTVLYRMELPDGPLPPGGARMEKLTNSSVSEASPSVMNDGRILYTRWEYVDKGAVSVKCLWAMHPDGSGSVEVYGNDIALPPTFLHARAIPGCSDLFVMLGTPHCPQNGTGTVIRVDTTRDIRTREPMTYITPEVDVRAEGGYHHWRDGRWVHSENGPLYADPYPLSGDFFLVSHNVDKHCRDVKAWDLYLIDAFGNKQLILDDPEISCWQPVPVRPRRRPPVLQSARDADLASQGLAVCVVGDVQRGLEGVAPGTVRYIRINEQVPRFWSVRRRWDGDCYDQQHACITKDAHLALKVQHGIVPVEADGSAQFLVPADRNIFFQALDENFMEVQRERTYVNYRPGETRSCVGCHEKPNGLSPPRSGTLLALRRPPSRPGPQPGERTGARPLHYPTDVQPILDKHCIKCHSGKEPKAGLDLSGQMTTLFSRSYENLLARRVLPIIGENHPKTGNVHYLPPKSLGSHASKLVAMHRKGHNDVKLSREEMIRLTTWVDSNGQYYGSYWGRRHIRYKGHPNFRPVPTFEQSVSSTPPLPEDQR